MGQLFTRELVTVDCCQCGLTFGVPEAWNRARHAKGDTFHCPNGHPLCFGKTTADELREKLASEKANADWWRGRADSADKRADHERSVANGYKGALTKVKKRVGNGVCPCCTRTFKDLARHMATQHPTFKASAGDAPSAPAGDGKTAGQSQAAPPAPVSTPQRDR